MSKNLDEYEKDLRLYMIFYIQAIVYSYEMRGMGYPISDIPKFDNPWWHYIMKSPTNYVDRVEKRQGELIQVYPQGNGYTSDCVVLERKYNMFKGTRIYRDVYGTYNKM